MIWKYWFLLVLQQMYSGYIRAANSKEPILKWFGHKAMAPPGPYTTLIIAFSKAAWHMQKFPSRSRRWVSLRVLKWASGNERQQAQTVAASADNEAFSSWHEPPMHFWLQGAVYTSWVRNCKRASKEVVRQFDCMEIWVNHLQHNKEVRHFWVT